MDQKLLHGCSALQKILTRSHGEVQLRLGHVIDVRLDETRRLALTNKRRGSSDDSLCARDVHDLEEEPGAAVRSSISRTLRGRNRRYSQAFDEPLHDTEVVHHLHEGNEEDDGRELEPHRTERLKMSRIESDAPC